MRQLIICLFLALAITACAGEAPPPVQGPTLLADAGTATPKAAPTLSPIQKPAITKTTPPPPPVQGPAVLADAGVEIVEWEYLGPNAVEYLPELSDDVKEVGNGVYQVRLVYKDNGFELVWGQVICAIEPVLVVHADASIEFWPGEIVDCELAETFHKLTVKWRTSIPFEQWKFTFHPPPEP